MEKRTRNVVYSVSTTRTYKSEDPSPGKETWDLVDTLKVLATDAEDAIRRVRDYCDREDKGDRTIKRRTQFVIDSASAGETLDIWRVK